jgi:putative CocE/NonD family hydrolase
VPAILEYLPYRKRDGTAARDERTHPYFAEHGYAGVRVDMRGNGDSDGVMLDEYLLQEQDDALQVIHWLTGQPWCDGNVGMMGISWGGFNALQVAARRPPALKAIVTVCSTDDRYADDIHYKGGALLSENFGWACTMFAFSSRPPDPAIVGERWREMWLARLEATPLLVENWLHHQRRDAYWEHGSVCEDFAAIEAAVLAVGGWGDAYSNAVPRMLAGLRCPARGIVGPWIHTYPHIGEPQPRIGFLQECLRWWDRWLRGRVTEGPDEEAYRVYMMESALPEARYRHRRGRWVAEPRWPSASVEMRRMALNGGGRLEERPGREQMQCICSPEDTGIAGGEYCAMSLGPEGPTDQRQDDERSLCFDSEPLEEPLEILGAPLVSLELSVDRPRALVAVRLCDVFPDGRSARVTFGVLNLTHRESHEHPSLLEPGTRYRIHIKLDDVAYGFQSGNRLRLAISTAYWPMVWPSPRPSTICIYTGASTMELPTRAPRDENLRDFDPPTASASAMAEVLRPERHERTVERDPASGVVTLKILDDFGERRTSGHGLATSQVARETHTIHPDDPTSARVLIHWTTSLARGKWQVRTETRSEMFADGEHFFVRAELDAYEDDRRVFNRRWDRQIPRDMV